MGMGPTNSLHNSVKYSEYNKVLVFDLKLDMPRAFLRIVFQVQLLLAFFFSIQIQFLKNGAQNRKN